MGQKKNLRYYLMIFGIAMLAILIYTVINWISAKELDLSMLWASLFLPFMFTSFLFVFDKLFELIFPKKKNKDKEKDDFLNFVAMSNVAIKRETDYSIEDFRKLQESERFQKTVNQLYTIYQEGESEDLTLSYLSKKFKKDTNEFTAVNIIIAELKKINENS